MRSLTAWGGRLQSDTVIELRGTLDESWSAALVVGYDWLTAQHEVAYVDILDILGGCTARVAAALRARVAAPA